MWKVLLRNNFKHMRRAESGNKRKGDSNGCGMTVSYYLITGIKVMGYREGAWFKNDLAKVFSTCNCYARVATTSNAVTFRSLYNS